MKQNNEMCGEEILSATKNTLKNKLPHKRTETTMRTKLSELSTRISSGILSSIPNESTTVTALVQPFISALGYDVNNPNEYRPEYPCDFRNQGASADGAVMQNGNPVFLIECKKHTIPLSEAHAGQLRAYFSVHSSVKLGILTNGVEYRFYTDSEKPNIMDSSPFLSFDLSKPDSVPYTALQLFSKSNYTGKIFSRLSVVNRVKKDILKELKHPSGELARIIFSQIDFSTSEQLKPFIHSSLPEQALSLIRPILSEIIASERIVIHKTTSHWCSIAVDGIGNIAEVMFNQNGKKWLAMNILNGFKQPIETISDIMKYADQFREATKLVIAKNKR